MSIIFYKVRCPKCKNIEKVMVDEIDWSTVNFKLCSVCKHCIRITDDYGFMRDNVIPVVRMDDE